MQLWNGERQFMNKCIVFCNQKGGVGKSTTANAVGAGLFYKGNKILYIDMDPQGNLTYSLGQNDKRGLILQLLEGKIEPKDVIIKTSQGDLIPSSLALSGIDSILTQTGREYRLKESIDPIKKNYDFIIIDTPPALGTLTINSLTAGDCVIIPSQADIYSLQGIGQLAQTIRTVKKYCNKDLYIQGIVITRYNLRTVITKDITKLIEDTAKQLNTKVYNIKIRECVAIKEAQADQKDIFEYSKNSNASADYGELVNEILLDLKI